MPFFYLQDNHLLITDCIITHLTINNYFQCSMFYFQSTVNEYGLVVACIYVGIKSHFFGRIVTCLMI